MAKDFRRIGGSAADVEGLVVSSSTNSSTTSTTSAASAVRPANKVIRNAYILLAISMIPAFLGGLAGKSFFPIGLLMSSPIMVSFGMLAIFYGLMFAIEKNNTSVVGIGLLQLFTFILGFFTGPILMYAGAIGDTGSGFSGNDLVGIAFLGTAGIFFAMAAIGSAIKKPLTGLSTFLLVGVIVLMIGVVANIFLQIPALALALSCAFLFISSLMIMYYINMAYHGGIDNYISLTLGLVVFLYNIFTSLLHLLLAFFGGNE